MLFNRRLAISVSEQEITEIERLFQDRSTSGWHRTQHGLWWRVVIPSTVDPTEPYGGFRLSYLEELGKKNRLEIYHYNGQYTFFHNHVRDARFRNWTDLKNYLRKCNQRFQPKVGA